MISPALLSYLISTGKNVPSIPSLIEVGEGSESGGAEFFKFLCTLYDSIQIDLDKVLAQRIKDRIFIDDRTRACHELNTKLSNDYLDSDYQTVLGQEDSDGRIVVGPYSKNYCKKNIKNPVAPIPSYLDGFHVTLFGPPDDAKLCINAMNSYHRKINNEPPIISELLSTHTSLPKWGADDEDSKTPIRSDLVLAADNLKKCYDGTLSFTDDKNKKYYKIITDHQTLPIKRFPGLALPCTFLIYNNNPLPLHLYDFALHLINNWKNPKALSFYVPKLENEEEARYIKIMVNRAEALIQSRHPEYKLGTVRLFTVLENPRAVFRVHEIMNELHPYFAGASLGWHDYLASTARLFKNDPNYRMPVKSDSNIVIKYIKASHDLLNDVVGGRGGIKIGGMYGVLPIDTDLFSDSFQVTIKGYIKDVITQLKRGLSGFWVAHPDFVRIGLALVESWKFYLNNDKSKLDTLIKSLLDKKHHKEITDFITGGDVPGLDSEDLLYPRSLLVADLHPKMVQENVIANNDPEEIRYNVFQTLQYLTDWLSGNGCVALPAEIDGVQVRVMDDLATAERSRWEVWHELHHGRFSKYEFIKIVYEEYLFIRKDFSNTKKSVQVKWNERTSKWYPIAKNILLKLMTSSNPVEFATELLLPFTIDEIRKSCDPWNALMSIDSKKYELDTEIKRINYYFEACGSLKFVKKISNQLTFDEDSISSIINEFDVSDIIEAACFHGNIGEQSKTLDQTAKKEQEKVLADSEQSRLQLQLLGSEYLKKFGFKYLISAQDKTAKEILSDLNLRLKNNLEQEIVNAKNALAQITLKRVKSSPLDCVRFKIEALLKKHNVKGVQIHCTESSRLNSSFCVGHASDNQMVTTNTLFEIASLSKTFAVCFCIEYFKKHQISLDTNVNSLLKKSGSSFVLTSLDSKHPEMAESVTLKNLMNHSALNMHYVNGVALSSKMPLSRELLDGNQKYNYIKVGVVSKSGTEFKYSGGGFLVLEHLIESLEKKSIQEITREFISDLQLSYFSFDQQNLDGFKYASGFLSDGTEVEGTRKMFPAFAAGALSTAQNVSSFLSKLTHAFNSVDGCGPISHETAVQMLSQNSNLSQDFMGADIGLGVFTASAGANKLAIHQGANDGFRCLYIHCYSGPDKNKGFVILCNADVNGVAFVAEVTQLLLKELNFSGIDFNLFKSDFDSSKISTDELVNIGYKELVFKAFRSDLAEKIENHNLCEPFETYNLSKNVTIKVVSNQGFARAENLFSTKLPVFDPELYGRHGKVMDSWETARHNPMSVDYIIFELSKPSQVSFVTLSTQFHLGNHVPFVELAGLNLDYGQWDILIPKISLDGHALKHVRTQESNRLYKTLKISAFPDGGLSRLWLYDYSLPDKHQKDFSPAYDSKSIPFVEPIPNPKKPLTPKYFVNQELIHKNWHALKEGSEVDVASSAYGGKIIKSSNEHYGPASQVISPYPPLNMFDGFESARSRDKDNFEEVVIEFARESLIHRIEIDFTFFKHNNPREIELCGNYSGEWTKLVDRTNVKAYAGNVIEFKLNASKSMNQIKIRIFPDGGINRIRAFSYHSNI